MLEITISVCYTNELQNVLRLLEQLNNTSRALDQEEIKRIVMELNNYLKTTSNFYLPVPEGGDKNQMLIAQLCHLYRYLKSNYEAIHSVSHIILKYVNILKPQVIIQQSSVTLSLLHEVDIAECMGYIFDITPVYIVIGYAKGLILFNKTTFEVVKKIPIDFYCYHYYKHPSLDIMILYYAQEIQFLVLINLITEEQKIISLHEIGKLRLSEIYTWHNNKCIIASYDEIDVAIDIDKISMKIVKKTPQKVAAYFDALFSLKKEYDAHAVDAIHNYIIFENTASGTYNITSSNYDVVSTPVVVRPPYPREEMYHDFYYEHGIFIAISEQEIQIVKNQKICIVLKPDFPCIFYDARFLDTQMTKLGILVSSYYYYSTASRLIIFQIDWDNKW